MKTANDLKIVGLTKLADKDSSEAGKSKQGLSRRNQEEVDEEKEES